MNEWQVWFTNKIASKKNVLIIYRITKINKIKFIRYLPEFNFADRIMNQYIW